MFPSSLCAVKTLECMRTEYYTEGIPHAFSVTMKSIQKELTFVCANDAERDLWVKEIDKQLIKPTTIEKKLPIISSPSKEIGDDLAIKLVEETEKRIQIELENQALKLEMKLLKTRMEYQEKRKRERKVTKIK